MKQIELPERPTPRKADSQGKRAQRARVARALGEHRMIPIAVDDVIAYLAAADWEPKARGALFRDWCEVVGVWCSAPLLKRAQAGRRRETNRPLSFEDETP